MLSDHGFEQLEKDNNFGRKFFKSYIKGWKKFDKAAKREEKVDYKNLSNEGLVEHLLAIIEAGSKQGHGYVADSLLGFSEANWFLEYLAKYSERESTDEMLNILREPTHRTFVNKAHLIVLEAACLKAENKNINKLLDKLVKEYYWIENNYLKAEPKTREQFLEEINHVGDDCKNYEEELNRVDDNLKKKEEVYKKIKASKLTKAFIQLADDFTFIQDYRKQVVLRLNHFIFPYLKELAKRLNFDQELIFYFTPFELKDFIKEPDKFVDLVKERQKGCAVVYNKDGYAVFTRAELEGIDLSNFFKDYEGIKEVKGAPASPGKVQGPVKVILGSDQFSNFVEGDILITNQTTPDFVPLMKKAKAIIAEQGGITSHAAIVSRELGIPCVVGVKDAMRIFKDGEQVEVDASVGIVRKL